VTEFVRSEVRSERWTGIASVRELGAEDVGVRYKYVARLARHQCRWKDPLQPCTADRFICHGGSCNIRKSFVKIPHTSRIGVRIITNLLDAVQGYDVVTTNDTRDVHICLSFSLW
jgi:hypothetical protein